MGSTPSPLAAQQPAEAGPASRHTDASVAFRFGTLGFGLEVAKLLASRVSARVGVNYFKISTTRSESNISYDASLKLHGVSVLIDLYPGERGSLHFTGGIVTNPLTISATGQPSSTGTYTINGKSYTSSQVGTLTLDGKFPGVCPYLGLGVGTPASTGGALKFLFDLGVAIGKPTLSLTAAGGTNPPPPSDLQAQTDSTQREVRKHLKVYPVLAFGLGYRF